MSSPTDGPRDPLPPLEGRRIRLRRLGQRDLDSLLEVFGDPRVARFIGIPLLHDLDDARALLQDIEDHARRQTLFQWGIARRGDDRLLGTCTLAQLDWSNRRAEIGCVLGAAHWGRGYASEAVPLLLDHAFGPLGLHRIEADADPRNEASLRLLEKLGFVREGTLRERHLFRDGETEEWQDAVFFGLLAGEWDRDRGRPRTGRPASEPD